MHFEMASAEVKTESEEVLPSTSGGDEQGVSEQVVGQQVTGEQVEGEESYDSDQFDDEFLTENCETVDIPHPMTISKELFYTDEIVARNCNHLSREDKDWFNQMKVLAESIKQEMGDYGLIEDLRSRVVAQCFGYMKKTDVTAVMGKEGKGTTGGKELKQKGGRLMIKQEPGAEPENVIVTTIVPSEEPTLLPYHIVEDEDRSGCVTIRSEDSDIEEIDKDEVRDTLKVLANLKRKEAECLDKLAQVVPEMRDSEVVMVSEKVRGTDLPQCVHDMYSRINHLRNFRAALVADECIFLQYKFNQAGTPVVSIPELCTYFNVGKTKLYKILGGGKYGKEEEVEKKPLKHIKLEPVKKEKEGPPAKLQRRRERSHPHQGSLPLQRRHQRPRPSPPHKTTVLLRTTKKPSPFQDYPILPKRNYLKS